MYGVLTIKKYRFVIKTVSFVLFCFVDLYYLFYVGSKKISFQGERSFTPCGNPVLSRPGFFVSSVSPYYDDNGTL